MWFKKPKTRTVKEDCYYLRLSINEFLSYEIKTTRDIMSVLIKLDQQTDLNITAEKDALGNIIPSTIQFSFNDMEINKTLAAYIAYKALSKHSQKSQAVEYKVFIALIRRIVRAK